MEPGHPARDHHHARGQLLRPVCPITFSPDGTLLAVGQTAPSGDRGHVYLWDLAAGCWAGTLSDAGKGISSLAFGPHSILAVGTDGHAYLWNVPARRLAATIAPPIDVAQGIASALTYQR